MPRTNAHMSPMKKSQTVHQKVRAAYAEKLKLYDEDVQKLKARAAEVDVSGPIPPSAGPADRSDMGSVFYGPKYVANTVVTSRNDQPMNGVRVTVTIE